MKTNFKTHYINREVPMAKKVSMDDLAKKLGISKNTVSLALRGMPGISSQTRQLVADAAKELGYIYNKNNDSVKNICLILSKSTRNTVGFFNYVQFGMEAEAKKQGLNIIIYYYDERDEIFETPLCIKEDMVSGIITLGRISRKTANTIFSFKLPLVMVDNYFDNIPIDYILTDNISGSYAAVEHLINSGHKNIGFVGNIKLSVSFYDRYQGYLKALMDYGLIARKEHIFSDISMEELANKDLNLVVDKILERNDLPDAVFCCNDAEAIAMNRALASIGVSVPEAISLIGFDDIEFSRSMTPELTTMRVEKELMGKKAVERLTEIMENPQLSYEKLLLGTKLIERKSVKNNRR
jgi:LacI family transcriptional regulator